MKYILSAIVLFLAVESEAGAPVETPTMGWSSWNAFRVNISEGTIKHHADIVKELELDKCGYVYINIDDGYFGGRDENGRLKTHPKRFPNGLKAVVPGHATRIYRLAAEKRLERRVYEAETAWMETYQELTDPVAAGTAYYKQVPNASGGVVAAQVGGKGGPLVWKRVWSAKGGKCDLALRVVGEGSEGVRLSVNGKSVPLKGLSATVDFKKGDNEVKVFGDSMLPDIDCLVLSAVQ